MKNIGISLMEFLTLSEVCTTKGNFDTNCPDKFVICTVFVRVRN